MSMACRNGTAAAGAGSPAPRAENRSPPDGDLPKSSPRRRDWTPCYAPNGKLGKTGQENCKVRGLVRFSASRRAGGREPSTENTDLSPSSWTLQFSCKTGGPCSLRPPIPGMIARRSGRRGGSWSTAASPPLDPFTSCGAEDAAYADTPASSAQSALDRPRVARQQAESRIARGSPVGERRAGSPPGLSARAEPTAFPADVPMIKCRVRAVAPSDASGCRRATPATPHRRATRARSVNVGGFRFAGPRMDSGLKKPQVDQQKRLSTHSGGYANG